MNLSQQISEARRKQMGLDTCAPRPHEDHEYSAPNVVSIVSQIRWVEHPMPAAPSRPKNLSNAFAASIRKIDRRIALLLRSSRSYYAFIQGKKKKFASIEDKFQALVEDWENYHLGRSVTNYDHIAYTQVVGIGPEAIPLLLEKLKDDDADWIYALKCITGEEAEKPEMHGDIDKVIRAWINWGKRYVKKTGQALEGKEIYSELLQTQSFGGIDRLEQGQQSDQAI